MRSVFLLGALAFAAGGLCAQSFTNNTPQAIARAFILSKSTAWCVAW